MFCVIDSFKKLKDCVFLSFVESRNCAPIFWRNIGRSAFVCSFAFNSVVENGRASCIRRYRCVAQSERNGYVLVSFSFFFFSFFVCVCSATRAPLHFLPQLLLVGFSSSGESSGTETCEFLGTKRSAPMHQSSGPRRHCWRSDTPHTPRGGGRTHCCRHS